MSSPVRPESPASAETGSPNSSVSDLSSPESNATSVCPHEMPQHFLVTTPPCDSPDALDAFLRSLPLDNKSEGTQQYLMLILKHDDKAESAMPWSKAEETKSLSMIMSKISTFSRNNTSLEHWIWVDSNSPADWAAESEYPIHLINPYDF